MRHITRVEQVPVPGWVYHWPRCECGWTGDIVRTPVLAELQITEHHDDQFEQPSLFD
ncbi:hypothetical protein [Nocardiopsis alba]|uniref:hypothetical protein n=1 Tax=Nocardiopsis alba TaxID=53437 RepID=UPI00339DB7AC